MARSGGCDALVISDHSDTQGTASRSQLESFAQLRWRYPDFLLFGGIEINMPSYGQREHVNVIVDPTVEVEVLPGLRAAAEDDSATDESFLRLAANYNGRADSLVMIYNHPSRKDQDPGENYKDILRWNAIAPIFIGFAGAPGHQNADEIGGYVAPIFTIDRWDPVVAEIGGTWDRLLSEGHQFWGAIAGSDYHTKKLDKIPCDFARTHVAAASFSHMAVIEGLRAGTFWADHGQILRRLSFFAEVAGIESATFPGSIVRLGGERAAILVTASLERGQGSAGSRLCKSNSLATAGREKLNCSP